MATFTPVLRGNHYHLRRRVPARYAEIETRTFVKLTLKTDSLNEARRKGEEVWQQMLDAWEVKLEGRGTEGDERLAAARKLAQKRHVRYMPAPDVAHLPLPQLLERIEAVRSDPTGPVDMQEADALLGVAPTPQVKISETVSKFYEVAGDRIVGKSEDQLRRHRAPRLKAVRNLLKVIPDKPIQDVTTDDLFSFRNWLVEQVAAGKIIADSANKDLTYIQAMWKPIARASSFTLSYRGEGLALVTKGKKKRTRPPFSEDWITKVLLKTGALDGLNTDARLILLGMVSTGYRPSEGAGVMPDEIRLDTDIPHLVIQPNKNRSLKNEHSERVVFLTGVSLEAFRAAKLGFQRYASNSATLSATVNKFLTENKLLESDRHSMYSLRHSFEDRCLVAGIDERIRSDLMGHGLKRERYGKGGDFEHIYSLLKAIAL